MDRLASLRERAFCAVGGLADRSLEKDASHACRGGVEEFAEGKKPGSKSIKNNNLYLCE